MMVHMSERKKMMERDEMIRMERIRETEEG